MQHAVHFAARPQKMLKKIPDTEKIYALSRPGRQLRLSHRHPQNKSN